MTDTPLLQLQLVNLDRKSPLRDQIYQLVRTLIIIGQLRPGQPVNEVEIAEQLGVSRTPVREAVKRLSDESLINVYAQTGTFVAEGGDLHVTNVEKFFATAVPVDGQGPTYVEAPNVNKTTFTIRGGDQIVETNINNDRFIGYLDGTRVTSATIRIHQVEHV